MIYNTTIGEVSRETLGAMIADAWGAGSQDLIGLHIQRDEQQASTLPHGYSDRHILPNGVHYRVCRDAATRDAAITGLGTLV